MSPIYNFLKKIVNDKKQPSLLVNALSNWIALIVTVLTGLFLTPYIIAYLGKTGYGIWILISSIIGYYGVLDLGITSAITRYVAHYAGQKNYKALSETVNTALITFVFIGVFTVAISFMIATPLVRFFNVSTAQAEDFRRLVLLLGLVTGLGFPGKLFGAVIRAREHFPESNFTIIITTLTRAGLIVLFLSQGAGLSGIAYSYLICTFMMIFLNFAICKLLLPYLTFNISKVHWHALRTLLAFGALTTVLVVADIMRFHLDSFVIGRWINIPAVGVYGVAALLIRFFLQFISRGTQTVFMPRFSAMNSEGKRDQLQQLFLKALSISAFLSFAVGSLLIILGKKFILLWVGPDFLGAVSVLYVLTICYSLALAQAPGISLVYALKKHGFFAGVWIAEAIVNVALSIYLAPRYGIFGVAIGTAVPMLVVKLIVQPIYVSRIIGLRMVRYWGQLLPALALAIGIIIFRRYVPQNVFNDGGYISLAISAVPYMAAFVALYFFIQMAKKRYVKGRIG